MTPEEQTEWNYIFQERIGIMCGDGEPTDEQKAIARKEADEHIKALKDQNDTRNA